MTVSRVSGLLLAAVLAVFAAGAFAYDKQGESAATAPPRALGESLPQSESRPPATDAAPTDDEAPSNNIDSESRSTGLPVTVNALGAVDGAPVGLLDSSNGGFGEDMWSGSSRSDIENMLGHVPLASPDPVVRELARRLVLTKAEAPSGPSHRALITIRIEKLLDAGLIDEAGALAARAELKDDMDFARVQAQAILLAGRAGDACGDRTSARLSNGELLWLELRTYCAAITGDKDLAELTHSVMDAQDLADAQFDTLLDDVLTNAKQPPGPISRPNAMHLFLLRRVGLPVDGEASGRLGAAANLFTLRDGRNPPDDRLAAVERTIRTGAVSTAELRAVAAAQIVPPDHIAHAGDIAPSLPVFAAQVVLRRAALLESRAGAKVRLLAQAFALARKSGLFQLVAGLDADLAGRIEPYPSNDEVATAMARALLLANQAELARHWIAMLNPEQSRPRLYWLEAALHLAAPDPADDGAGQALRWFADGPPSPQRDLVLGLYDALGLQIPDSNEAWKDTGQSWPGRRLQPEVLQRLSDTENQPTRKGEAVLLVLNALGTDGVGNLAPDAAARLVRSLQTMGEDDTARRLAIEMLLLGKPPAEQTAKP